MKTPATSSQNAAAFLLYVAIVLSIGMLLFPPFTSINGTEYAFLLTGPAWANWMGATGESLGLTAHIHWVALLVQLAVVWAIALGAKRFLGRETAPPLIPALLLGCFGLLIVPAAAGQSVSADMQQEKADQAPHEMVLDESVLVAGPIVRKTPIQATATTQPTPVPQTAPTVGVQGGRYGLGLASSWPAYGISGTLQLARLEDFRIRGPEVAVASTPTIPRWDALEQPPTRLLPAERGRLLRSPIAKATTCRVLRHKAIGERYRLVQPPFLLLTMNEAMQFMQFEYINGLSRRDGVFERRQLASEVLQQQKHRLQRYAKDPGDAAQRESLAQCFF